MTLARMHFYLTRAITLGLTSGYVPGLRHVSVTKVLFIKCVATVEVYVYTDAHTPFSVCPSMVLLSLCIKPLSPITLTPRRSRSIRIHLPQPPHLSRFHPRRFIEASTPSSTGSSRSGCLARSLASISAGCIAKSITV